MRPPLYEHFTVNHSKEFVNKNGFHTNNIEATWAALKLKIPKKHRNERHLMNASFEQMWRAKHKGDLWKALLEVLRTVEHR